MRACVCARTRACTVLYTMHCSSGALFAALITANFRDYINSSKMFYCLSILFSTEPPLFPSHFFLHLSWWYHHYPICFLSWITMVNVWFFWDVSSLQVFQGSLVAAQFIIVIRTVFLWRANKDFCRIQAKTLFPPLLNSSVSHKPVWCLHTYLLCQETIRLEGIVDT